MVHLRRSFSTLAFLCFLETSALAGTPVTVANPQNSIIAAVDANGLHVVCTLGCIGSTSSGFTPAAGASKNLSVSGTSNDTTLPAGTVVVVTNTGATDAFFRIQAGSGTAFTTDYALKSGAAVGLAVGSAAHISAITASSTTTFNLQGGSGQVSGYGGGGSSGGGGGGAVFGPTAAGSAAANPPVIGGGTADGTATGTVKNVTVKAASTTPVATDTSVVVAINPNSATPDTVAAALTTCATGTSSCTWQQRLAGILASAQSPIPTQASTVPIGGVGLLAGTASVGSIGLDPSQTPATTVAVNVSTATTTQLVALSGSTSVYVTGGVIIAGGTGNITFEYGTGSSCGTGTTVLSGAIPLVANVGFVIPANTFVAPSGKALCILTSAAVQYSGAIGYVQK